jgi:hypothetical protein
MSGKGKAKYRSIRLTELEHSELSALIKSTEAYRTMHLDSARCKSTAPLRRAMRKAISAVLVIPDNKIKIPDWCSDKPEPPYSLCWTYAISTRDFKETHCKKCAFYKLKQEVK